MALYPVKKNGILMGYSLENPAFGGVSAMTGQVSFPQQNQLVRLDNTDIGLRVGDTLYELGIGGGAERRGATGNLLSGLGVSFENLPNYNLADITGYASQGAGLKRGQADIDFFKQNYQGVAAPAQTQFSGGQLTGTPLAQQAMSNEQAVAAGLAPALSPERKAQLALANQAMPAVPADSTTPPAGATWIRDPKELSGLTPDQIWRDPNSKRIYKLQQATLVSPTGQKKVVAIGSQEANDLFRLGYQLGERFNENIITVDSLKPEPEIDINGIEKNKYPSVSPEATIETTNTMTPQINDYIKMLTPPETDASKQEKTLASELSSLLGETAGKETMLQDELKKQGVDELKKSLTNINNEISIKTAALNKHLAEIEATPMTLLRQSGAEAAARRIAQADIIFLQARAQGLMNNITYAQELAQQAVDTKFNPILEQISIKTQQLGLIKDVANEEEKTYIKAVEMMLAQQKENTEEKKKTEQNIQNIMLKAIQDGITDSNVLKQISNAATVEQATQIYGQNMKKEIDTQVVTAGGRQLLVNTQTGETIKDLGGAYKATGGGGDGNGISETFSQAELSDPIIQQYANWVEQGVDANGNEFKINNVPVGTKANPTRNKVIQFLSQEAETASLYPEADIFQLTGTQAIQADMAAIIGSDGYVDTAIYRQIKTSIAQTDPDLMNWFENQYPPKKILNPNDPTAQDLLGKTEQFFDVDYLIKFGMNQKEAAEAMRTVELYRQANFTDKEILKMMQE